VFTARLAVAKNKHPPASTAAQQQQQGSSKTLRGLASASWEPCALDPRGPQASRAQPACPSERNNETTVAPSAPLALTLSPLGSVLLPAPMTSFLVSCLCALAILYPVACALPCSNSHAKVSGRLARESATMWPWTLLLTVLFFLAASC
jgi:hypothetical protein